MRIATLFLIVSPLLTACSGSSDSSTLPEDDSLISENDSIASSDQSEANDASADGGR